ncbi:two-component sensor histidine kinase [Clostridium zeae]|uniref:histidine kinase n=1 Tax=Clostridium zeae TaxID=2759022 RepID=A0ABQ1EE79_9CLOT|nr:histidine kinase [Clostridium zeae]GFZ32998.1 two-component sensor histidine kinase [Clostridium zeae]
MENSIIISKLIIILYTIIEYINSGMENKGIVVLWLLIYCALNSSIYIQKKHRNKKIFNTLSIVLIITGLFFVYPITILFLPINIYEISDYYLEKKILELVLAMVPIPLLDRTIAANYLIILGLSYVIFIMAKKYSNRCAYLESQADKLRMDMHKLTKSFNENKEFLRQSEYTFKLEERNRLSQEIHDKIGHSMTGALIQMEAAKSLLDIDKEKAKELLTNSINISKEGIEEIRITLKNIKPPKEQMGINRLKFVIDEFIEKSRIKTAFIYKGDIDKISYMQWKIIFENISEALTNSMKYSEATNILVNIEVLNKFIKAEVKDNGKGTKLIKKGLGIVGMEERTAAVDGKIIVDGTNGFTVTTLLPIK